MPVPPWFSTLIGEGLAALYLLCLEGCPAADATPAVRALWINVLWSSRRVDWHEEADASRIKAAFAGLCGTCTRWPAPVRFWEALPSRPAPRDPALPSRIFSLEERKRNMEKINEIIRGLVPAIPDDDATNADGAA
jgi:hypothetical protein